MAQILDPAALFQSLSDRSRLRLLRLLDQQELNVRELVAITDLSQPRVSKHLSLLRDQGWLRQRREGTSTWYRTVAADDFPGGALLCEQVIRTAAAVTEAGADDQGLVRILANRKLQARDFFASIAHRWDEIRQQYEHPDLRLGAIGALVSGSPEVLDIGTGTGAMLPDFASVAGSVVALDHSRAMLDRARALCRQQGLDRVRFCRGEVEKLPFGDGRFDACNCAMVLHHVNDPAAAIKEMARVIKPRGKLMVTAFDRHEQTWMREELAHRWLGFGRDEMTGFFRAAGLEVTGWVARGRHPGADTGTAPSLPTANGLAWPELFLVTGQKTNPEVKNER